MVSVSDHVRRRRRRPPASAAERRGARVQRGGDSSRCSTRAYAPRSRACGSSSCSSTTARATARRRSSTSWRPHDPRVRVVFLSRNFGHQTALTAGLDHAEGDAVVMLDADLQDPPELIPRMLDHWREGCDVVYAVRQERDGESRFKLSTARWFYRLFDKLAQVDLVHNSGDFRLLDRRAARCAAVDARAQPVPARDDGVGRLHAGGGPVRPRSPIRRRDEVHALEDAALLARRDLVVLAPAAAARDAAGLHRLDARVHRDPGRDRAADRSAPTSRGSAR